MQWSCLEREIERLMVGMFRVEISADNCKTLKSTWMHHQPSACFSPLYQLCFESCLLCCLLNSCFGVLNCFSGHVLNFIACG